MLSAMLPAVDTTFTSMSDARQAILIAIGDANESFKPVPNNNAKRWAAKCYDKRCPFYTRISIKKDGLFHITHAIEHACPPSTHENSKQVKSTAYLAHRLRNEVSDLPKVGPKALQSRTRLSDGRPISAQSLRRAKMTALARAQARSATESPTVRPRPFITLSEQVGSTDAAESPDVTPGASLTPSVQAGDTPPMQLPAGDEETDSVLGSEVGELGGDDVDMPDADASLVELLRVSAAAHRRCAEIDERLARALGGQRGAVLL